MLQLAIPSSRGIIRYPLKDAPERVRELLREGLLVRDALGCRSRCRFVARLGEGDVVEERPGFGAFRVQDVVQAQPGEVAGWVRCALE